ncbi:FAD-dependent oxidoreductase [Subtercola sp. PAMC28395]|uniref:NAD(P)/FAD-dependent oxidoreductase n=1 Tax=Subtercola sp. PAMC28395 TaxID=2846775 RepID=UPI001C0D4879|nr:FAD-dependent oxidoreductase [Subtercola sp. PAMC28395]QWT24713.1 FAD-dependent oxidoreductase [Subtercola sp. PAMC28395]
MSLSSSPTSSPSVLVVGSGIAGLACARALHDNGVSVRVVDRGRVVGGRLATKRVDDRPADIGARYFTVPEGSGFTSVVEDWVARGLARPWTTTFDVFSADGTRQSKSGPMRYAAPGGLRSLATDLADRLRRDGVTIDQEHTVEGVSDEGVVAGIQYDNVVLAMPDPQARRMLGPDSAPAQSLHRAEEWEPTLSVVATWPARHWPADLHGAFVNGSSVLDFVADDGDRRGDGAAVLVAHTTAEFARKHLDGPENAVGEVVDALRTLLAIDEPPSSTLVHRWSLARPKTSHAASYLVDGHLAVCGDSWGDRSAVATAWESGTALGTALAPIESRSRS